MTARSMPSSAPRRFISSISPPPYLLSKLANTAKSPAHNPSPDEMRELFEGAGFTISDQHRVERPRWTQLVSDLITVGTKAP